MIPPPISDPYPMQLQWPVRDQTADVAQFERLCRWWRARLLWRLSVAFALVGFASHGNADATHIGFIPDGIRIVGLLLFSKTSLDAIRVSLEHRRWQRQRAIGICAAQFPMFAYARRRLGE